MYALYRCVKFVGVCITPVVAPLECLLLCTVACNQFTYGKGYQHSVPKCTLHQCAIIQAQGVCKLQECMEFDLPEA